MEKIIINLLNRMFLHCKIAYGDPIRLEALLQHYLNSEFKVTKLDNCLQAKYGSVIIDFELNEKDYIFNIKINELPEQ